MKRDAPPKLQLAFQTQLRQALFLRVREPTAVAAHPGRLRSCVCAPAMRT